MKNEIDENKDEHQKEFSLDFSKGIPNFLVKTIVVTVALTFAMGYLIESIPTIKIPETEKNKLIFLSFIQNPYVLWRLSLVEEEKGNFKKASVLIEAAIGLMEMNGASDKALKKYQDRLEKLKESLKNHE